jgi:hypothetical protein
MPVYDNNQYVFFLATSKLNDLVKLSVCSKVLKENSSGSKQLTLHEAAIHAKPSRVGPSPPPERRHDHDSDRLMIPSRFRTHLALFSLT